MIYEILVTNSQGDVISIFPQGHNWKSGEINEEVFSIVNFEGNEDEIVVLSNGSYNYHFDTQDFWNKYENMPFKRELVITHEDAIAPTHSTLEVAKLHDPEWEKKNSNPCEYFNPSWLPNPYDVAKNYFLGKLYKIEKLIGKEDIKKLIATIQSRDFGDIYYALNALSKEDYQTLINSEVWEERDRKWIDDFTNNKPMQ